MEDPANSYSKHASSVLPDLRISTDDGNQMCLRLLSQGFICLDGERKPVSPRCVADQAETSTEVRTDIVGTTPVLLLGWDLRLKQHHLI